MKKMIILLLVLNNVLAIFCPCLGENILSTEQNATDSVPVIPQPIEEPPLMITKTPPKQKSNKKKNNSKKIKKDRETQLVEDRDRWKMQAENRKKQIDSLNREVNRQKKVMEELDKKKNDKIDSLQKTIVMVNKQRDDDRDKFIKNADNWKRAYDVILGQLTNIVNYYKSNKFDELIKFSTQQSVERDIRLIGDSDTAAKSIMLDLQRYFNTKAIFDKKFNPNTLSNEELKQLMEIKTRRASQLIDPLIANLNEYKDFNEALIKTINNIIRIDERWVANRDEERRGKKRADITSELFDYIFNYDEFFKYPYLSRIIIEIITRKGIDPDESIEDLRNQLTSKGGK